MKRAALSEGCEHDGMPGKEEVEERERRRSRRAVSEGKKSEYEAGKKRAEAR